MSQSGYTPIQLYRTATTATAPSAGNLTDGELAINYNTADMALYAKNSAGSVKSLINNPAGLKYPTADGTANQVLKTDGSGNITMGTVAIAAGGTGATTKSAGFDALSPMTTAGDLILGGASGTGTRLAIGTSTYILTSNGTTATWTAPSASFTYPGAGISVSTGSAWGTSLTAPSGTIVGTSDTQTLTNKRVTPRVSTATSSATPTINTDNVDIYGLTAQAVNITSFTTNLTGTPTDGQKLWVYIVGTAARSITWGASFESSTATLPTTTVTTNRLDIGFVWNAATSKWRCVGSA